MAAAVLRSSHLAPDPDPYTMAASRAAAPPSPEVSDGFTKGIRSRLQQSLRAVGTRGKAKSNPTAPALDDFATLTPNKDKGKTRANTNEHHGEKKEEKERSAMGVLRRLESKVPFRRPTPTPTESTSTSAAGRSTKPEERRPSFQAPSLRSASRSSPALHLSSAVHPPTTPTRQDTPREHARRHSSQAPQRDIGSPTPLAPRRANSQNHGQSAPIPIPQRAKNKPPPLYASPSGPSSPIPRPSYSPTAETILEAPTLHASRGGYPSPPGTPTTSTARGLNKRAAASSGHLPLVEQREEDAQPQRARSPTNRAAVRGALGSASASASHLPLSGSPSRRPSMDARRPSIEIVRRPSMDARRPSVEMRRPSMEQRRPSVEATRQPFRAESPARPTSPTSPSHRPYTPVRVKNASTTSLLPPSNPEHRELIRAASSLLCREMVRPPAQLRKSGINDREWEEVELRLRNLARLERIWGKSGFGAGAGGSQTSLHGQNSTGGEERERRLFSEALRDGYVLCQFMNKLRPGSLTSANPREDGVVRTVNVTRFLAACSTYDVPPEDLFRRDDLLETTSDSLARVASTILALYRSTEAPSPDRSKFIQGSGQRKASPYGGTISRASSSAPSLNLAQLQRAASPSSTTSSSAAGLGASPVSKKRWSPPTPLPPVSDSPVDGNSRSSSSERTARTNGCSTPIPESDGTPPITSHMSRSPLRARRIVTPERISVADSTRVSVGESVRASIADSTTTGRQSLATTYVSDASAYTALSLSEPQRSHNSGQASFGTVRTVTTDATSFLPSEDASYFPPSPSVGGFGLGINPDDASPRKRYMRERKPSETAVVDLTRVMEETEPSSSPTTSSAGAAKRFASPPSSPTTASAEPEAERQRAERIRLGKGKWPDDFLDVFGQLRTTPIPTTPATAAPVDVPRTPIESAPISSSPPRDGVQFPVRRPTHRARHSMDAPTLLLPKNRDVSPGPITPQSAMARRASARATSQVRNGVYLPRGSLEDARTSSTDSESRRPDPRVPFPRTHSGDQSKGAAAVAVAIAQDAQGAGSGSGTLAARVVRGRFQSEIDGTSSRRRPRPTSLEAPGAKPGRSRFESMVNLGVESNLASASDLLARDSMSVDGSSVRQTLIVKDEGKPTTSYQLGNCIGRGQFGSVYRALNLNTGQMVAVKRVRLEGMKEDEIKQLMHEVELVRRLSHPSIVKYEGFSRDQTTLNIVLEYAENGSLLQTTKAFGKLNERLVANYTVKILEGLDYLHTSDVVHCDLKAANILTTKTGNVKLSDFGVSLNMRAVKNEMNKDVQGTPNWMAPEVIELKGATFASDIWSLGCTVVELFTGRPPYAEIGNSMAVMFRIVDDDKPPIPDGCSVELRDFLTKCFQKDPTKRPTAEQLCDHPWLGKYMLGDKDMRPQDSIPFIRRVSTDYQKHPIVARYLSQIEVPSRENSDPTESEASVPLTRRVSNGPSTPLTLPEDVISPREHLFVKTSFGKPMKCRVCLENVKKSAVICEQCSLISHSKCKNNAPPTCDLRSQLLLYAQYAERGNPGSPYTNAMDILAAAQAGSIGTGPATEPGMETPRTSIDYQPSQAASSQLGLGHHHPPISFKGWMPFMRSRSSLSGEPQSPALSTSPSEERGLRKRQSVLKKPGRSVERPRSLSSNSTSPNTSSMRSAATAAESFSSRKLGARDSVATATATDADPTGSPSISFAPPLRSQQSSRFTVTSDETYESAQDPSLSAAIPGSMPMFEPRHPRRRERESKSSSKDGCSVQ